MLLDVGPISRVWCIIHHCTSLDSRVTLLRLLLLVLRPFDMQLPVFNPHHFEERVLKIAGHS
jgi:hypothetical protein